MNFLSQVLDRVSQYDPLSAEFNHDLILEWAVLSELYYRQIRNWVFLDRARTVSFQMSEAISLVRVLYRMPLEDGGQADIIRNSLIRRIESRIPWKLTI